MDPQRFGRWTKTLATGVPRRTLLRGLAATLGDASGGATCCSGSCNGHGLCD